LKQEQNNDLKSAFILLKCSKRSHNDCRKIRDAMFDELPYVQEAYTTNAKIGGEQWCVAASALVPANKTKYLERKLRSLVAHDRKDITVDNLKLLVDHQ